MILSLTNSLIHFALTFLYFIICINDTLTHDLPFFFFFCCCFLTPLGLGLVTESTAKLVHFNSQHSSESPLEKREPSLTMQLERV